ncbi:phytanoyl-CoA dioxygenase family protein [Sandaracinobacter neustonicus]|uniref:Phytanoyl-CoA dioxygenase family protein n=1 Tax=Sandaracinobacter neustonicus TaxID=1715348 RepID=A0A501XQB0_9SPHN|nr:phytanoyl-CoA dioxygenase family protein [Sandaracinobacter neustonicus]TPE62599.1 phytanoyl-CoA dioxygenase family protein [Sandaracinobacter neustonicus]
MMITADLAADIAARADELSRTGFCIIPNALPVQTICELDKDLELPFSETPFGEGGFYGTTTIRFGRLLARSAHAAPLVQHRLILGIVDRILSPWCDCIQLNTTQAIAVHPGAPAQLPHRDQDMWRGPVGEIEYLVNVMWPLTPFTPENGATRVWPGTHGGAALLPPPEEVPVAAAMQPGDALLFLGSALHGAGANLTHEVRRGIVIGYALGWLKPYENQWLAYPPDVARQFSPELAALVGYRQHRPNLGNYEGQCPSVLLAGASERPRGAIDALRPDQKALVDAYVAEQLPAS